MYSHKTFNLENIPFKATLIKKKKNGNPAPAMGQQKQCQGAFLCVLDGMIAKLKTPLTPWSPLLSHPPPSNKHCGPRCWQSASLQPAETNK